jgi:hypothetical protein
MTFYPERFFGTIRVSYSKLGMTASRRAEGIGSKGIQRQGMIHGHVLVQQLDDRGRLPNLSKSESMPEW